MKTIMKKWNRILAQVLVVAMLLCTVPFVASAAELPQSQATFTFTDQAITGAGAVLANEISGTTLTIKQSGVYTVNGSCAEGNIVVAKGVTGVTLVLDNFKLISSKGAPISVEANAELKLFLVGTNALENKAVRPAKAAAPAAPAEAAPAEGQPVKKAPAFVGAAIKVKSNAKLVITGEGVLFLNSTVKTPISCAKNAKATIKGNALNFKTKKAAKKAAAPAAAPAPAETPVEAPVEETAAPVADTVENAAQAAPVVENAETEEGAPATVNAKKNNRNAKAQKNRKNNAKKVKPLDIKAGATLTVKDAEGNVVLTAVAPIDAKQVIFVSEKLTAKKAYTLFDGETQISKATARASQSLVANTNNKKNNKKNNKNNKKNNRNNRNNWNKKMGKMPARFGKNVKKAQPAAQPAA